MKFLIIFAAVIAAISAVTDLEKWEQFKKTYNRTHKHVREEKDRFAIFQKNLRDIEEHNNRYNNGVETYYKGINRFADWTSKELRKFLSLKKPTRSTNKKFARDPNFVAPESVDWRESDAVLEVKDQQYCGSCWAFSATGAIEGQNALKYKQIISLSEQELVDCSADYDNHGCDGGHMEESFQYIIDHGIATQMDYPYSGWQFPCKKSVKRSGINVTEYIDIGPTEDALLEAVASVGPISVYINADLILSYKRGIFNDPTCSDIPNHAVLAVGYGSEGNLPYWILKNSWGNDWGEYGYFRMIRGAHHQCGLGQWSTYPIIA